MRDWPPVPAPLYRTAVFLDRDGTVNVDTHYPHRIEELSFIPGSLQAFAYLSRLPIHIIVVSNQAGIAKGLYRQEQMSRFNEALRLNVQRAGGRIDAFYYCPHLERKDISSEVPLCECSKPSPGMLLEAAEDYQINLASSFMVGDKTSDIVAGAKAGCITILVLTGKAGKEEDALPAEPKHVAKNLLEAALLIVDHVRNKAGNAATLQSRHPHFKR